MCHAHSYRLTYLWHPILILSTSLFVVIQNTITFRGILSKALCPFVTTFICDSPPQACLFTHHSTPYIQFSSYCPCSSKRSKGDTWLDVRHGPAGVVDFNAAKQNSWLYICSWVSRSSLHLSIRLSVCRLFHRTMNSSSHPPLYRCVRLLYLPYLKTRKVLVSSTLRDSRSCGR